MSFLILLPYIAVLALVVFGFFHPTSFWKDDVPMRRIKDRWRDR